MKNEFWLNMPVSDLNKSKEFYVALGFEINAVPGNPTNMVSLKVGKQNIILNLFEKDFFQSFAHNPVATADTTEVFLNLGADTKEEVDQWAEKATAAGGKVIGGPGEKDGWMYGCGFADPDGHRWGILWMDMSKFGG